MEWRDGVLWSRAMRNTESPQKRKEKGKTVNDGDAEGVIPTDVS